MEASKFELYDLNSNTVFASEDYEQTVEDRFDAFNRFSVATFALLADKHTAPIFSHPQRGKASGAKLANLNSKGDWDTGTDEFNQLVSSEDYSGYLGADDGSFGDVESIYGNMFEVVSTPDNGTQYFDAVYLNNSHYERDLKTIKTCKLYVVNHDKGTYINLRQYLKNVGELCADGKPINPLFLLCADALAFGDYRPARKDFICDSQWAYDRISITLKQPSELREIQPIYVTKANYNDAIEMAKVETMLAPLLTKPSGLRFGC